MHTQPLTRPVAAIALALGLILVAVPAMAAAPSPAWTKQFGSTESDYASGVAVDAADRLYVVGWTCGSITGWPSRGSVDAYVRKLKPDGKKLWTKQFGTTAGDYAEAVAVDRSGNAYVAGYTEGSLAGTNKGGFDALVRKYKPNGKKAWTRQFGSADGDVARGVAVDQLGRVYVAGNTNGSLAGTNKGSTDAFVRKYKPNGATPWTRQFGTGGSDSVDDVAVDQLGRVYVAGTTQGSLVGTNKGSWDAFLRKYRSDGDTAWTSQFGTADYDHARAVAVDSGRRAIVAGTTSGSITGWPSRGGYDAFVRVYKR